MLTSSLNQLLLLERVGRTSRDVDLHSPPRGSHQVLDDDRVPIALILEK